MQIIFTFLFLVFLGSTSYSSISDEVALYFRCHSQFVRKRPAADDYILKKIKLGQLMGPKACLQLLNEVTVIPPKDMTHISSPDSRAFLILRTFQALHMSWFPNKDLIRQETETPTTDFYDTNEIGYHFTYSLFNQNSKFSEVVTRAYSFRGVRYHPIQASYLQDPQGPGDYVKLSSRNWELGRNKNESKVWKPKLVEFGKLIGIAPMSKTENFVELIDGDAHHVKSDLSKSLGGGVLGSLPYILVSSTMAQGVTSDGGSAMHRSWSRSIFSDLLCRQLPVLYEDDVKSLVQKESYLPFRREIGCMQCHATMDPLAGVIRNISDLRAGGVRDEVFSPRVLATYPTDLPALDLSNQRDGDFFRRPTEGKLIYRNYVGSLVEKNLSGIKDLGQSLSENEDLYICAAKRYFDFLTGIDVEIDDFSRPPYSQSSNEELKYRNFVIEQGQQLKKHQSLKKLIEAIIQSQFYASVKADSI